jgi:urease accessory protein
MNRSSIISIFTFLALVGLSSTVQAHPGAEVLHDFSAGFFHPFMGVDHLLTMVAVGLWAVRLGGRMLWMLPLVFLMSMLFGATLGFAGVVLYGVEGWIAFSVLIVGVILSIKQPITMIPASILTLMFALGHGYVHAAEATEEAGLTLYIIGFLFATAMLHAAGILLALLSPLLRDKVRIMFGAVCTVVGVALLSTL